MIDARKKLPLPVGRPQVKHSKKTIVLLALLLLGALGAAYLFFIPNGTITSTRAFLNASVFEIQVNVDGKIAYIAQAGQPVTAGEAVIKMDTTQYEQEISEAAALVSAQSGAIPPQARNLMLHYLAIPQSEAELTELLQIAQVSEKNFKAAYSDLLERQAIFSLELRRLELKHNRLSEEEDRMEAMRVEEILLHSGIKESQGEYETASLGRAAAEKILQQKCKLGKSLRSLPINQREQLYELETEFNRMYEAEKQIATAKVETLKNGKVMYALLSSGDYAHTGDTALYILPEGDNNLWVTAYFTAKQGAKIKLGASCTITFGNDAAQIILSTTTPSAALSSNAAQSSQGIASKSQSQAGGAEANSGSQGPAGELAMQPAGTGEAALLTMQGFVSKRLPQLGAAQSDDVAFKIALPNINAGKLIGINPKEAVQVTLTD